MDVALHRSVVEELVAIVGERHVLCDAEARERYAHDEVAGLAAMPDIVVRAGTTDEVARIMRVAHRARVPVTPRGAGTA